MYTKRVIAALLNLWDRTVVWPTADHRVAIKSAVHAQHGIPQCVGFVDGTLFPLAQRPNANGEDYFDRKSNYSLNAMVVCQHDRRITYIFTGIPGSYHDQRVFNLSALGQAANHERFFSGEEFILADSAYTPTIGCVPIVKKPANGSLTFKDIAFNEACASARVVAEHTIGLLKMRWQSLRGLSMLIRGPEDVQTAVHWIMACVVLHNLLLGENNDHAEFGDYEGDGILAPHEGGNGEQEPGGNRGPRLTPGVKKRNRTLIMST